MQARSCANSGLRRLSQLQVHLQRSSRRLLSASSSATASSSDSRNVCLVIGAGSGVGAHVAKVMSENGLIAAVVRRRSAEKLDALVSEIEESGGRAVAFCGIDCTKEDEVQLLVERVEAEVGPIICCVYNVGAQMGHLPLLETPAWKFKRGWELGAFGAFLISKEVATRMLRRPCGGTIIFTSSTAAFRGNAGQAAHASAMAGRRMLAQSLHHELGPQGVHVCHVLLDGMVVSPDTLGKMWSKFSGPEGEAWEDAVERKRAERSIIEPRAVGEEFYRLHTQPRGSWTFEMDLRPWTDKAWFHS